MSSDASDILDGVGPEETRGEGGVFVGPVEPPPLDYAKVHPLHDAVVHALMAAQYARAKCVEFKRLPPVRVRGPIPEQDFVTLFNYYGGVEVAPEGRG